MAELGDFPLPDSFKLQVLTIEKMGFSFQRKRIIELILEGKETEEMIDILLEERTKVLEEGKKKSREGLLEILASPFGEEVLEKMAELSLKDHKNNDTLNNFVALIMSENKVDKAYAFLKEEEE
mmetsp:Transcript_34229/g.53502  ORF Transcript_34229/g.53502 Transcript_34229/m.53502 type:complete len:124 (-) Transcript_34229:74-445(-)|eukprot:CAMPEP_0201520050 /NCGR_PEP_ID=MMETSP0161_2-20130828/10453_1 /ASSEMBLY_ACC=CAM_ASM_000251 /TAXON_ID=180227 /ORGANISM="Neoparamoeba aestuarina, Strain SoJaBio B1-5/56/2" /LENGTH=123 /DNA_ID=CAMNT_0047918295 /DNA_START=145 /DNA_END=516 /DNA_ORIENTATION=-